MTYILSSLKTKYSCHGWYCMVYLYVWYEQCWNAQLFLCSLYRVLCIHLRESRRGGLCGVAYSVRPCISPSSPLKKEKSLDCIPATVKTECTFWHEQRMCFMQQTITHLWEHVVVEKLEYLGLYLHTKPNSDIFAELGCLSKCSQISWGLQMHWFISYFSKCLCCSSGTS